MHENQTKLNLDKIANKIKNGEKIGLADGWGGIREILLNVLMGTFQKERKSNNFWEFELDYDSVSDLKYLNKEFPIYDKLGYEGDCGLRLTKGCLDLYLFDKFYVQEQHAIFYPGVKSKEDSVSISMPTVKLIDLDFEKASIDILETATLKLSIKFSNIVYDESPDKKELKEFTAKIVVFKKPK